MLLWGTYCSAQRPDKNTVLILYTNIQNRINNYSIHALTNTQRKLGKYLENMQIKLIPQNGFVLNCFYLHTQLRCLPLCKCYVLLFLFNCKNYQSFHLRIVTLLDILKILSLKYGKFCENFNCKIFLLALHYWFCPG